MADAQKSGDASSYQKMAALMSECDNKLQEYVQETTKDQVARIIKKLETIQNLSSEEHGLIKLWMVGDAEYYMKLENSFKNWLIALRRGKWMIC